jgi:hypothetical protein
MNPAGQTSRRAISTLQGKGGDKMDRRTLLGTLAGGLLALLGFRKADAKIAYNADNTLQPYSPNPIIAGSASAPKLLLVHFEREFESNWFHGEKGDWLICTESHDNLIAVRRWHTGRQEWTDCIGRSLDRKSPGLPPPAEIIASKNTVEQMPGIYRSIGFVDEWASELKSESIGYGGSL